MQPVKSAESGRAAPHEGRAKGRDVLELSVAYGLILLVLWIPRPWQRGFYWAAILWVLATTFISFEGWQAIGVRAAGFLRSFWIVVVALALAAAGIAIASHLHTLHHPHGAILSLMAFWGYVIWSFVQQLLLQGYFLLRLLRLMPSKGWAAMAAAGIFAAAHIPNPILTPLTFVWGAAACFIFLRYRNIFSLGLAHAIFGITIAIAVPSPVTHRMRVGRGYLTYRYHPRHHRYFHHNDQMVSTAAWVMADAPTRRC